MFFFFISTFISQGVHLLDQIANCSLLRGRRSLGTVHSLRLLVFANRVYDNHKANESKGMVMSVSSEQTALPSPSRATHASSTLGNLVG